MINRILVSILVLFVSTPRTVHSASAAAPPYQGCNGCQGSSASATASSTTCGGSVSIQVSMESGKCRWLLQPDPEQFFCRQTKACTPHVGRSWAGLPAGTALRFCTTLLGQEYCLDPQPNAGIGTGSDDRNSADMNCGDEPRDFSISAPSCGVTATVTAGCARCLY
jgi:hypothetical protein